jgi:tetratricopeptide (TPR) repeat protein
LRRRSRIGKLQEKLTAYVLPVQIGLLGATVLGSLLAVGTVHVNTLLAVASAAILSFVVVCFTEKDWASRIPAPTWVLLGLSLYSLLQSVPLPFNWVRHLSPAAAQVWIDARRLVGAALYDPAALSLDPAASRVEALKWLTYGAVFATAAQVTRRAGAKRGLGLVVLAALVGGVLTLAHGLFGIDKWLGIYQPRYAHPTWALSPLLNSNNYCGYLNLATFVAIGLAMTGRPPAPRWALGLTAAVLFALSFLTGSRGGVLALLLGVGLVALALREQTRRARRLGAPSLPSWLPLAGAALAGSTLFLLGSNDTIWAQLLDETTSKIRIVEWTAPLARDYLWFGVGRGAYETVAAAYRTMSGLVTYQHAENFLADWVAEWGVVVCATALACFFWLLRPNKLGFLRHPIPTASLIGVLVLVLQNLVDLGLEVAAVGIALATVLGSLWGGSLRDRARKELRGQAKASQRDAVSAATTKSSRRRRADSRAWGSRLSAGAALVLGAALLVFVARTGRPEVLEERRHLHDEIADGHALDRIKLAKLQRSVATALARHPADAYVPVLGAIVARQLGQNELVWLNHALRRDPLNARAELLLADALARRGAHRQALGVLRRCATHEPNLAHVVAERATRYSHAVEELELSVPEGQPGVAVLNALAQYLNKPETRSAHDALLALALKRQGNSAATHGLIIDDLLRDLESPSGPCVGEAGARCEERLRQHAQVIEKQGPHNLQAVILRSRLLAREGKIDEAVQWLSEHCHEFTSDAICAAQWVTLAARAKSSDALEEAGSTYLALACSTPEACASAATWIGNNYVARGNYESALLRFERAANEAPSADAWLRVADAALRSGHVNRAQTALISARRFGSAIDPNLIERVEQARREQLMRGALKQKP